MKTTSKERPQIANYIIENKDRFQDNLLSEAVNVATKINDILTTGNIDLLANAQKLVLYVVENKHEELVSFAKLEGIAWAQNALTLSFKLEWIHAIRRTLWHFLYQYDQINGDFNFREGYYELEKKINDGIDDFLNSFFISYSDYKDELIKSQRKMVEHLSVPIIPVSQSVAVLPLIGTIDLYRIQTIEEKVLMDISRLKINTLIIDLSGITDMDDNIIFQFQKVLIGVSMMGGKSVISGLRPELVKKMIHTGISFDGLAETNGTLQQTLKRYFPSNKIEG